jgi:hypothetical protein
MEQFHLNIAINEATTQEMIEKDYYRAQEKREHIS